MRLIDADALERDGWQMSRTVRISKEEMELQIRKPTDFPTIEPQRMRGKWIEREVTHIDELEAKDIITAWQSCKCSVCGRYDTRPYMYYFDEPKYCSWCGADMRGTE